MALFPLQAVRMEHDTAPRWERRKASRPDEILDAALPLFVERGYAATKIEHIAQAAGVTKGTPYLYFENKAEIFKIGRASCRERVSSPV